MAMSRPWFAAIAVLDLVMVSSVLCINLFDECSPDNVCPTKSQCTPKGCAGMVCLCLPGYVPNLQLGICVQASDLGHSCDGINTLCSDKLAVCIDGGCQCRSSYVPALDNLRCKLRPFLGIRFSLLDEKCDGVTTVCQRNEQEICDPVLSQCVCKPGLRRATPEELQAEPFLDQECRPENFTLNLSEVSDCPEVELPVSSVVGERCFSYNNCPKFADCLPGGCLGNICVCIDGYYPAENQTECRSVVYLNDACDDGVVCYDHGRTTDCVSGLCVCKLGYVATSDSRCKPTPEPNLEYALYGETCGHIGAKRIVCHEQWTTCDDVMNGQCVCQYGTREVSAEEKARHTLNGSPCRLSEFQLDISDETRCERQKELALCQDWRLDEIFWRDWFKQRLIGEEKPKSNEWDWAAEWKEHRDRLRACSEIMPPSEDDNWSEEVREMRIPLTQ